MDLARDVSKLPAMRTQASTGTNGVGVIMVQIINPATEQHLEQIKSALTALGVTAPNLDDWDCGEVATALILILT